MKRIHFIAPALAACLFAMPARASNIANAYGISQFGGKAQCGTPSMTHPLHRETAALFENVFVQLIDAGVWDGVRLQFDGNDDSSLFTDPSTPGLTGADRSKFGIDNAAVSFLHTHGKHGDLPFGGVSTIPGSELAMGASGAGLICLPDTGHDFRLGDPATGGLAEIAVIKACESADFDVWKQGSYKKMVATNSRFQIWNGFDGDSSCDTSTEIYVWDYAAQSLQEGVGENWIDDAYSDPWFSSEDCPVSMMFASSRANSLLMYRHGGFNDRNPGDARTMQQYIFVAGCSAENASPLPDP